MIGAANYMVRLVLNTRNGGRLIERMVVRIGKRLVQLLITLLGVTFITFSLTYMAPGDPVAMLLETGDTRVIGQNVLVLIPISRKFRRHMKLVPNNGIAPVWNATINTVSPIGNLVGFGNGCICRHTT